MKALGTLAVCLLLMTCAFAQPQVKITTDSPGKGPVAKVGDTLAIAYEVRLADGTFIEATGETPYKVRIGAQDVIPGLSQGLVGIRREEKRTLTIPPELAYGAEGSPPGIPPNSTLIFKVDAIYRSSHDHNHDDEAGGDHGHEHKDGELGDDGSHGRPDAASIDRPAISEFLIRDFYTKPWQYDDAPTKIWRYNAVVTGIALSFLILGALRDRKKTS